MSDCVHDKIYLTKKIYGPWKFHQVDLKSGYPKFSVDTFDAEREICVVTDTWNEPDVAQKLCHMISSVPDLINALEVCLGHMTGGLDGNYADTDPVTLAVTVLKKAQGQQ